MTFEEFMEQKYTEAAAYSSGVTRQQVDIAREAWEAATLAEREAMRAKGWRKCAKDQHTTQFCGQLEEAVKAEREECLKLAEEYARHHMGVSLWPFVDLLRKRSSNA